MPIRSLKECSVALVNSQEIFCRAEFAKCSGCIILYTPRVYFWILWWSHELERASAAEEESSERSAISIFSVMRSSDDLRGCLADEAQIPPIGNGGYQGYDVGQRIKEIDM